MKVAYKVTNTPKLDELEKMILDKKSFFLMPQKKDILSYLKMKEEEITRFEKILNSFFLFSSINYPFEGDFLDVKVLPRQFFPKEILEFKDVENIGPLYSMPSNYDISKTKKIKVVDLSNDFMLIYLVFDVEQCMGFITYSKKPEIDIFSLVFDETKFSNY